MVKLSFIVPVYNVERYLRKCVDSLLAQDYSDYEIILVDDGSTDESPQICNEYACSNELESERIRELGKPVIRVIHQKNGGLSVARNAGLKEAKGEYVCFVDSDDYWEENVLDELIKQVERENLDVLHFDYQNVRLVKDEGLNGLTDEIIVRDGARKERKYEVFQPYKFPHPVNPRMEIVSGEHYLNERMGYGCYAWQFVLNREISGTFMPGIHFEDTEWLPRMMLAAKRVNSTTRKVYNYFWREGSITLTQGDIKKVRRNVEDVLAVIEHYNGYIAHYPNSHWLREMRSSMAVSVLSSVAQHLYTERKEYIKRLKGLGVFPLTLEAKQGKTYLRKARIINLSPRMLVELLHLKNRK